MPDGMTHAEAQGATGISTPTPTQSAVPAEGAKVMAGHLRRIARIAASATERRNTIPILGNLRMEVEDGALRVIGTDMELALDATVAALGTLPAVTADARTMLALTAGLPDAAEVTLLADAKLERLIVSTESFRASILTLPAEDFPTYDDLFRPTRTFEIPVPSLRRLLALTAHAISMEETRYYLNGVYLHPRDAGADGKLCAVATDGHRLMLAEEPLPAGAQGMPGLIIPRKTTTRLLALLNAAATGSVKVEVSDTKARFSLGSWSAFTKAIDGTFPDYVRVIPHADYATRRLKVVDPRGLARAADLAVSVSMERSRPLRLEQRINDATLWITADSPYQGSAEVKVPAEVAAWEEPSLSAQIGFQARYLAAVCGAVPGGFTCRVIDKHSPMRIDFPSGTAVLMPMRV